MLKSLAEWNLSDFASAIGGLFILIFFIIEALKKAISHTEWAKKRLEERDKKKEQKAHEQYEKFTNDFVEKFVPPIVEKFEKADTEINNKLDKVLNSSNDLLRQNMTSIYYKYLPYKKILQFDKKQFIRLKEDYENQGGNSYIGEIWKEIQDWEVVESKEDLNK